MRDQANRHSLSDITSLRARSYLSLKPLGVMQRSTLLLAPHHGVHDHESEEDGMDVEVSNAASPQWDMVAVVKKKIVFSKRPMPIVGAAAMVLTKG